LLAHFVVFVANLQFLRITGLFARCSVFKEQIVLLSSSPHLSAATFIIYHSLLCFGKLFFKIFFLLSLSSQSYKKELCFIPPPQKRQGIIYHSSQYEVNIFLKLIERLF